MCRKIVVASGKGGVGKTTLTACVGMSLAKKGQRVLLIDADLGLNNLDVVMGIDNKIVYDMTDVIQGKCRIKNALIQDERCETLFMLPSAHAVTSQDVSTGDFRALIARLQEGFDYILIDCPAGIEGGFHRAVMSADECLLITTPHISAIKDADRVQKMLLGYNYKNVTLVVNRLRPDLIMNGHTVEPDKIAAALKCRMIGIVPEDDSITVYGQLGRITDISDSEAMAAFALIAENIRDGTSLMYDYRKRYGGIFGKLKLFLRKMA